MVDEIKDFCDTLDYRLKFSDKVFYDDVIKDLELKYSIAKINFKKSLKWVSIKKVEEQFKTYLSNLGKEKDFQLCFKNNMFYFTKGSSNKNDTASKFKLEKCKKES